MSKWILGVVVAAVLIASCGIAVVVYADRLLDIEHMIGMQLCPRDDRPLYRLEGRVWRTDPQAGEQRVAITEDLPIAALAKSDNGKYLAYTVTTEQGYAQLFVACSDGSRSFAVLAPRRAIEHSWIRSDTLLVITARTVDRREWSKHAVAFTANVLTQEIKRQTNPYSYRRAERGLAPRLLSAFAE